MLSARGTDLGVVNTKGMTKTLSVDETTQGR